MKKALITGVNGQDGSYLAESLLENEYEVHGIKRRLSLFNKWSIDHDGEDPRIENRRVNLYNGVSGHAALSSLPIALSVN